MVVLKEVGGYVVVVDVGKLGTSSSPMIPQDVSVNLVRSVFVEIQANYVRDIVIITSFYHGKYY